MVNWGVFWGEASGAFVSTLRQRLNRGQFTDTQVTQTVDSIKQLTECDPMTNDLDPKLIGKICGALAKGNEEKARRLIEAAKTREARGWCIDALKGAATLICSCGPKVLKEATFNLLAC